jgi:segregation and condensation protein A
MPEETRNLNSEPPAPGAADEALPGGIPGATPDLPAHIPQPPKRVSHAATSPPPIKLEIYEGPLDLLLDLIRKQQINIYDIPIAKITKQYLDYLHLLEAMNIDVAGEFIFTAATLIHIKSRLLLPPDPTAAPEEQEDPRTELVQRLLEHEQFKTAAEMLLSKRLVEDATWSQPGIAEFAEAEDEPGLAVSVFDIVSAFRDILERAKSRPQLAIRREVLSVAQMIEQVKQILLASPYPVRLDDLASGYIARQALIALFLALLEMVRLHAIQLRQKELFAPITVHKNKGFEELMSTARLDLLQGALDEEAVAIEDGLAGENCPGQPGPSE